MRCPNEHDACTKKIGDDVIIVGAKATVVEDFKKQMSSRFEMTDLGELSYYLGIEVQQGNGFIELKQAGYARKVLEKASMASCNASKYPMDLSLQMSKDEGGKRVDATDYKSLVGYLRYLVHTRPDIS